MEHRTETRVGLISIIVKDTKVIEQLNEILHAYRDYIIGRMGIPYREKSIQIISVAIDAPQDVVNALSGKIGRLSGVSSKVAYANE
ncbi:TM1266 family iron-only hydrogenase system putative regulator [Ihubacter sp. rT4E-8]|uniref:TM1266 family iron-only hydrogenase system putative regulator n=1 Tax=unclassified Ihubacter TaxID=2633299 RepID=UPI003C7E0A29